MVSFHLTAEVGPESLSQQMVKSPAEQMFVSANVAFPVDSSDPALPRAVMTNIHQTMITATSAILPNGTSNIAFMSRMATVACLISLIASKIRFLMQNTIMRKRTRRPQQIQAPIQNVVMKALPSSYVPHDEKIAVSAVLAVQVAKK